MRRKNRQNKKVSDLSEEELRRLKEEQERDEANLKQEFDTQEARLAHLLKLRQERRKMKKDQGLPEESEEEDSQIKE